MTGRALLPGLSTEAQQARSWSHPPAPDSGAEPTSPNSLVGAQQTFLIALKNISLSISSVSVNPKRSGGTAGGPAPMPQCVGSKSSSATYQPCDLGPAS